MRKIAVLGAGNGGCAAAADLANRGYEVRLCSRSPERLQPIAKRGGIEITGVLGDVFVHIPVVTNDVEEAATDADLIMIVVPGPGHEFYAKRLAPMVSEDQIVMLNPGHCGGALHFHHTLQESGVTDAVRVCETNSLTYGCRLVSPAKVWVYASPKSLLFAAFPGKLTLQLLSEISPLYPALFPARDVLETGLLYLNGILHPPGMVLNASWIEGTRGGFKYYYEGTTPSVARTIEAVDNERADIMRAVGLEARTFIESFHAAGYTTDAAAVTGSVYRAFQESEPNKARQAPPDLSHRYMHEDVGYGIVPMSEIGKIVGKPTPVIDSLIILASTITGVDYFNEGLNANKLGIAGLAPDQLCHYVATGKYGRSGTNGT